MQILKRSEHITALKNKFILKFKTKIKQKVLKQANIRTNALVSKLLQNNIDVFRTYNTQP